MKPMIHIKVDYHLIRTDGEEEPLRSRSRRLLAADKVAKEVVGRYETPEDWERGISNFYSRIAIAIEYLTKIETGETDVNVVIDRIWFDEPGISGRRAANAAMAMNYGVDADAAQPVLRSAT